MTHGESCTIIQLAGKSCAKDEASVESTHGDR